MNLDNLTNIVVTKGITDIINREEIQDFIKMLGYSLTFTTKTNFSHELDIEHGMVTGMDITKDDSDGQYRSFMYPRAVESGVIGQEVRVDTYDNKKFNLESFSSSKKNCKTFVNRLVKKLESVSISGPMLFEGSSCLFDLPEVRKKMFDYIDFLKAEKIYDISFNTLQKSKKKSTIATLCL
jgi:hypothetical protein|tara:strand:+ start:88 stop:630 length:543 start_codon:yes stop_codon:yes gene_type:complete